MNLSEVRIIQATASAGQAFMSGGMVLALPNAVGLIDAEAILIIRGICFGLSMVGAITFVDSFQKTPRFTRSFAMIFLAELVVVSIFIIGASVQLLLTAYIQCPEADTSLLCSPQLIKGVAGMLLIVLGFNWNLVNLLLFI
ncbi:hypothetical protein DSO57_1013003 [Entomophthora muscae]|uniref:Uncharacterized protein n=1 Tax=Entomophthora muscae TaxID=34485 RepID=A0ACC2UQW9_9FUNG|nr:hypothetical protein DSO57_1013003 [Entomophthora muscae]